MNLGSKFLRAQQETCLCSCWLPLSLKLMGISAEWIWEDAEHVGSVSQQRSKGSRKLRSYLRIDGNFPILLSKVRHYLYPGTYEKSSLGRGKLYYHGVSSGMERFSIYHADQHSAPWHTGSYLPAQGCLLCQYLWKGSPRHVEMLWKLPLHMPLFLNSAQMHTYCT